MLLCFRLFLPAPLPIYIFKYDGKSIECILTINIALDIIHNPLNWTGY